MISLSPKHAFVFVSPDSPANLMDAFDTPAAMVENQSKVQAALKSGKGVGGGEHAGYLFCSVARMFQQGYVNALVQGWLPALDGVVDLLTKGAAVSDIGCGYGISTIIMEQAFPKIFFSGDDFLTVAR